MSKFSILAAIAAFCISGCSFLGPVQEVPLERKAELIKVAACEGAKLAIREIYEGEEQSQVAASLVTVMRNQVLPLLNNPDKPITQAIAKELIDGVPEEWTGIMAAALETLNTYYDLPSTSEIVPPNYLILLKAFFEGLERAGLDILEANNVKLGYVPLMELPAPEVPPIPTAPDVEESEGVEVEQPVIVE